MKQKIKPLVFAAVLSLFSVCSFAQEEYPTPRWVSDKGYWVIEGNIHSPKNNIIWFYNNDNVLVYKEVVSGIRLNPNKRKVKMKLKKVLESSVTAWEEKGKPAEEGNLVKTILK
jgi:hypothetical protein